MRVKRVVSAFWLVGAVATPSWALDFKGFALGSHSQQLLDSVPTVSCDSDPVSDTRTCLVFRSTATTANEDRLLRVGSVALNFVGFSYYRDRLYSIHISYRSSDYPNLRAPLAEKFGSPERSEAESRTNGTVTVVNRIDTWKFGSFLVILQEQSIRIGTGSLSYADIAIQKQVHSIRKPRADDL